MKSGSMKYGVLPGALIGCLIAHPLVMLLGEMMVPGGMPAAEGQAQGPLRALLRAFTPEMLPWSLFFAAAGGAVGLAIQMVRQAQRENARLIAELRAALAQVRTLSGLLPICAACKKIRDDKGYWTKIETYISQHSDTKFTHGICPACEKRLYPELQTPEEDKDQAAASADR